MPTHPAARPTRPVPVPPEPSAPPRGKDLTVNKVLAGAGAAATSAVLGSYFGAAGTVAGAALGSVASTIAATIYQRYLDRTRDTLVARIRPVRPGNAPEPSAESTVPMPRLPADGETVRLRVEPAVPARSRRRWVMWAGATVLVFVIAILAVTGIEWIKGSALTSNDSGTSVGRVFGADGDTSARSTPAPADSTDGSVDPTSTPDPTADPSGSAVPGSDANRPDSTGAPSSDPPATGSNGPDSGAPTTAPALGGLLG